MNNRPLIYTLVLNWNGGDDTYQCVSSLQKTNNIMAVMGLTRSDEMKQQLKQKGQPIGAEQVNDIGPTPVDISEGEVSDVEAPPGQPAAGPGPVEDTTENLDDVD